MSSDIYIYIYGLKITPNVCYRFVGITMVNLPYVIGKLVIHLFPFMSTIMYHDNMILVNTMCDISLLYL